MNNTVVVCVDGSPSTGSVCDYAAWAAAGLSAPLALLHVLEKDGHPAVSDLSGSISIDSKELLTVSPLLRGLNCHVVMVNGDDASLHDAQNILQAAGIDAESRLIQDESVSRGLCRYAEENGADLIVMGAWRHSRLRRFFIGSHTTSMLAESRHPLLMLR